MRPGDVKWFDHPLDNPGAPRVQPEPPEPTEPRLMPGVLLAIACLLAVIHLNGAAHGVESHQHLDGCVLVGLIAAGVALNLMTKPAWEVRR